MIGNNNCSLSLSLFFSGINLMTHNHNGRNWSKESMSKSWILKAINFLKVIGR